MKYLIISDTHHKINKAREIIKLLGNELSGVIHLGDMVEDAEDLGFEFEKLRFYQVAGNCDYFCDVEDEKLIEIGGHKIFMTHGHRYRVKSSLEAIALRGRELGAEIVMFGHTHIPVNEECLGVRCINPGSLTLPRSSFGPSYGLLEVKGNGNYSIKILDVKK